MINSEVATWNFYPASRSNITISNCIFGELLAFDTSNVLIQNSICDGTGGYLGAINHSFVIVISSFITSQVIAKENGFLIGGLSAFNSLQVEADDFGVMALLGTSTLVEPEARNSAIIFEEKLPPVEGLTQSEIGIEGSARIIKGPLNTVDFNGYSVMYSEDFQNPVWQKTDGLHLNQVTNDTLAVWNTAGLQAGQYALVLTLYHTLGDSLALPSSARLNDGSTGIIFSDNDEFGFRLDQNYPNPFNPNTNIRFQIPENGLATLKIYDILGTEITTLISDELSAGNYDFDFDGSKLTSGIYFYRLTTETFSQTRKMILIK
jgi:hypothetical protein